MKIVKPQRLSLLSRTFEHRRTIRLSVAALVLFDLEDPRRILTEASLWKTLPPELGRDAALDAAMPKARAEFLVTGFAFPPGGAPAIACAPCAAIGPLEKTLRAIGDRTWVDGVASSPVPFTRLRLGWEHGFGGPKFPQNPLGKGAAPMPGPDGQGKVHPLPNLEDPRQPIRSLRDRPAPAGFGPIDLTWPQRARKAGTYDCRWQETTYPGLPDDLDWTFFNVAAEDQQRDAPFQPGEPFRLEHLHPERRCIEGRLPGAVARCFATIRTPQGEAFREIPTRLDTVWFFPHLLRGVLVFHGSTAVAEDDADDVLHLVAALEEAGRPRPADHYREVLALRLDRQRGALAMLDEAALVPPWPGLAEPFDPGDAPEPEVDLLAENQRRAADRALAELRETLAAEGYAIPEPPGPPPAGGGAGAGAERSMAEMVAQAQAVQAWAEQGQAEAREELRAALAAQGLDPDAPPPGGPPTFSADEELAGLRAAAAEAPDGAFARMASGSVHRATAARGRERHA
ncbi:MAG: DUF2169 domain-containing protein [Anaeromyxobacter sp.]